MAALVWFERLAKASTCNLHKKAPKHQYSVEVPNLCEIVIDNVEGMNEFANASRQEKRGLRGETIRRHHDEFGSNRRRGWQSLGKPV